MYVELKNNKIKELRMGPTLKKKKKKKKLPHLVTLKDINKMMCIKLFINWVGSHCHMNVKHDCQMAPTWWLRK